MRFFLISLLMLLGLGLSGFFVVDQREVGIIKSDTGNKIFTSGLHWKIPFYDELSFVYTNQRSSEISSSKLIKLKDGSQYTTDINVIWQVSNPQVYIKYLQANSSKQLSVLLAQEVTAQVLQLATNSDNAIQLLQNLAKDDNRVLPTAGITILSKNIMSLKVESMMDKLSVESSIIISSPLSAESSYQLAQQIKLTAESKQSEQFSKLEKLDPKFYSFYMKINQLEKTAKTKNDVPALDELYK